MKTSPYSILILEPDDAWYDKLSAALAKRDYMIYRAKDAERVLELCRVKYPDLLLLEQRLDEKDGIELVLEIREDQDIRKTPIIMHSIMDDKYTQIAAYEAGVDVYAIKGGKMRLLAARIMSLLRRSYEMEEPPSVVLNFGDIDIDVDSLTVFKNGVPVKLSKKEFDLLLLLTSKPGKVFRRPNILKKIWGEDIIVGDRNIDTHIKKLRQKLGKEHIQTSRGVGYKFLYNKD